MAFEKTRSNGTNPRTTGTNPRALGENERTIGKLKTTVIRNKWAYRAWKKRVAAQAECPDA